MSGRRRQATAAARWWILAVAAAAAPFAAAQEPAATDTIPADDAVRAGGGLSSAINRVGQLQDGATVNVTNQGPFFSGLSFTPKAGVKANVRQNTYYGEAVTMLKMRAGSSLTNSLGWSYDEYRKQNKNVEKRNANFNYGLGQLAPLIVRLDGDWSWSHDKTVNTAGFSNLFAQDNRSLRVAASKTKYRLGDLTHSFKLGGSVDDRMSENQGTPNNSSEASLDGGLQTGWEITRGLVIAGRIYGSTASGERTLGATDSPSSANGDSLGLGVYFARGISAGSVSISRGNFERRYLDFRKNSSGLIDTVGIDEDLKVVQELETRDAMTMQFESTFGLGPFAVRSQASRTTDDLNYQANGQGLRERQLDEFLVGTGVRVGADSVAVTYEYGWKWDDQRILGATANRGRQYNKNREFELIWTRSLFSAAEFKLRAFQGLSQDIAQFQHNQNDKDRLQNDFSVELGRRWHQRFATNLVYSYRSAEDRAIRETRSSNNNIKTSYEIAPDYTWYVAPWLTWNQIYRVYIQYTDYVYSDLPSVTREDNYNKRGNLTTKVTLVPTARVELVLRHDFNKKFNATKSGVDGAGNTLYSRDLNQTISKLDLGLSFKVMPGVMVEAATYRTRDDRESFGRVTTLTTDYSGEIWVGTRVNKTWTNGAQLSALVKKYNAFGPSVTQTSADYWEADVWLKWEF